MSAPPAAALTADLRATVELVLAEVLNNVAEHAYCGGPGEVEVALWPRPSGLACEVVDTGAAMPQGRTPSGRLASGAGLPLADQPEGGFGWHLIRSLTCDLAYDRSDGRNRLRFVIPRQA
jgi:serine/threonine-protein kinase RsbW